MMLSYLHINIIRILFTVKSFSNTIQQAATVTTGHDYFTMSTVHNSIHVPPCGQMLPKVSHAFILMIRSVHAYIFSSLMVVFSC